MMLSTQTIPFLDYWERFLGWENLTLREGELTEVHFIEAQVHPNSRIG